MLWDVLKKVSLPSRLYFKLENVPDLQYLNPRGFCLFHNFPGRIQTKL